MLAALALNGQGGKDGEDGSIVYEGARILTVNSICRGVFCKVYLVYNDNIDFKYREGLYNRSARSTKQRRKSQESKI